MASASLLIVSGVLLSGLAAIAWIAFTNRSAWTQHDADVGTGDNTEFYRSVVRDMHQDGGWIGGGDGGGTSCGDGDAGGACH